MAFARSALGAAALGAASLAAWQGVRRLQEADLDGHVAIVTGASRGLGLLIARELLREGCSVAICARTETDLQRARDALREHARSGREAYAAPCDVSDRAQVERFIGQVTQRFGRVDVLVNNAGIIQVGPLRRMTHQDFERAMAVMYWGVVHPTLALLPQLLERRAGRILNVTSIGGKAPVAHLAPYCAAKFAATGFSEGLRLELAKYGVTVTTICPGLMRTGSHLQAEFKAGDAREFAGFAPLASWPGISMDAERAARQIVRALKRGDAEHTLSLPATLLARAHGLFPGLVTDAMAVANRVLPDADAEGMAATPVNEPGMAIQERLDSRLLERATAWGLDAARRFNQLGRKAA